MISSKNKQKFYATAMLSFLFFSFIYSDIYYCPCTYQYLVNTLWEWQIKKINTEQHVVRIYMSLRTRTNKYFVSATKFMVVHAHIGI